jgi:tetratricopeptide (TPR) repeat protein
MTRIVTIGAVILILTAAIGCTTPNTGRSQRLPQRTSAYVGTADPALSGGPSSSEEIDLVEQMTTHRQAYRQSLESLIQYYDSRGNNQKVTWARDEMTALDRIPQYRYIFEVPTNLKATEQIAAADQLYAEAAKMEQKAGLLPVLKDEETLRAALGKYGDLIRQYPTSDKIDDAAFRMGDIHEYFRDFTIALQYYQRAYQWDPMTPYPARFRAAAVLDRRLRRRAEALELYQEAIIKEAQHTDERIAAERRIKELTTSDDRR